ncbi:MAG: HPr family phosphocarrier protein [Oscillospiraceae bacterium]|nr:HPr family phosphocarrier protein [Oscillospiraceae bacterium]
MEEFMIKLNSIDEVKEFVTLTNNCAFDVDLMSGRYAIDAKSIMGIFSLDLSKPLKMIVHAEGDAAADFVEEAAKFIAD